MHKHIYFILPAFLLVVAQTTLYAQTRPRQPIKKPVVKTIPAPKPDLLVRLDGTQLDVLVVEITDKEIVYKRASNPSGPNFRTQKADFSYLKYGSNGEIERFATVTQPGPTQPAPTPVQAALTPAQAAQTRPTSTAPVSQSRQVKMPQGFRFGFKGGIQNASFSFSINDFSHGTIFGFQAGLLVDRPLGTSVRVRSQLLYSSKGSKVTYPNYNNTTNNYTYNYIEVPIDVLFKIPTSSGQLLLGGGGYFGYALSGKNGSRDLKIGNAQTDDLTSRDFGLRASGWYDLPSGLTLNVFYNLGLANINPTISTMTVIEPIVKNRTFGLGVGYFLSR